MHDMALRSTNVLSLCAGVGGLELGIALALHHRGARARGICYVEREAAAAASLVASMEQGWLHPAPVWSDLLTFDARPWCGLVHILASGDPCQENSVAAGEGDVVNLSDREAIQMAADAEAASKAQDIYICATVENECHRANNRTILSALSPFADRWTEDDLDRDDESVMHMVLTVGQARALVEASAALAAKDVA